MLRYIYPPNSNNKIMVDETTDITPRSYRNYSVSQKEKNSENTHPCILFLFILLKKKMQTLYERPIFYFKLNHVKSIPVVNFFLF